MSNNITTLYHGSNVQVDRPEIIVAGFYKDFGYGFYCTSLEKQATALYLYMNITQAIR